MYFNKAETKKISEPLWCFRVLKLLEMLVVPELHEEREEHMQALYHAFISPLALAVDGDVAHGQDQACVVCSVHIDFSIRELELLQRLLELRRPFLHKRVEIRHRFRIVNSWCRSRFV